MKFRDYFDRIRIISLPGRLDRRREVTDELERHGIPLEPGKVEFFDGIRMESDGGFTSIGMHGCYLSHLKLLQESRAAGLSNVLILEDDFQLSRKFDRAKESLVSQLQGRHWDLAYFGHLLETEPSPTPTLGPVEPGRNIRMLHFYAVNAAIFDRLISFLEAILARPSGHPDGGPMAPDGAVSAFRRRNPDVVTLIVSPNLCWQRSSRTDAHDLRWFDRTPVVRDLVQRARGVKSWVGALR